MRLLKLRALRTWTLTDVALVLLVGAWAWWALGWWEGGVVLSTVMLYVVGVEVDANG